jgi:glycolate oxidase FAD binding subunit
MPDCSSTLLISSKNPANLLQMLDIVLRTELQPASVVLTMRLPESSDLCASDHALLIRFVDNEAAVQAQVNRVTSTSEKHHELKVDVLSQMQSEKLWRAVADFEHRDTRIRISVPLSTAAEQLEQAITPLPDCIAAADMGTGIIRLAFDADDESVVESIGRLRAGAASVNGSVVIEKASLEVRRRIDSWGDVGSSAKLMRSIKTAFDPQSLLNPGKFVLGL